MIGYMMDQKMEHRPKSWLRRNFLGILFFAICFASFGTFFLHLMKKVHWFGNDNYLLLLIPGFVFQISGLLFFMCGFGKPKT